MHAASQQHPRNVRQACIPCTCELPNCTPVTAELPLIRFALQYAGAPQGTCKRYRRRGRLDLKLPCTPLKHRRRQTAACATGCHCASRTVQPAACWICNEPSGYAGAAERPHRATEPSSFSTSTPFFRQRVASAMRRCSARWASTAARSPGARHSWGAPNEARAAHHASTNETWTTSGTDAVSSCLACHPSCGCSAGSEQRGQRAGTRQHSPREAAASTPRPAASPFQPTWRASDCVPSSRPACTRTSVSLYRPSSAGKAWIISRHLPTPYRSSPCGVRRHTHGQQRGCQHQTLHLKGASRCAQHRVPAVRACTFLRVCLQQHPGPGQVSSWKHCAAPTL